MLLHRACRLLCIVLGFSQLVVGCTMVGPKSVPHDRFDYNGMIARSWQEQTLLNIVKVRYLDVPVFLEVSQVVSGYTLERSFSLGGSNLFSTEPGSFNFGGTGSWTERPTVTYTPLTGDQFNRSLLVPLPPPVILFMSQSGWSVDPLFLLTIDTINGIESTGRSHPTFMRLVGLMHELEQRNLFSLRIMQDQTDQNQAVIMVLRSQNLASEEQAMAKEVREILGLDQSRDEFRVSYGSTGVGGAEVGMRTRSMMEILLTLSKRVEVPALDMTEGRATIPPKTVEDLLKDFRIRQSLYKPEDALVTVPYRGRWFWIDDRELKSKLIFAIIMALFTQTESDGKESLPLVTIPAG